MFTAIAPIKTVRKIMRVLHAPHSAQADREHLKRTCDQSHQRATALARDLAAMHESGAIDLDQWPLAEAFVRRSRYGRAFASVFMIGELIDMHFDDAIDLAAWPAALAYPQVADLVTQGLRPRCR